MQSVELKLKQASAVLGVPPKELQNLVQFGVLRPRRRARVCFFDANVLLQAKVAGCSFGTRKDSIGSSYPDPKDHKGARATIAAGEHLSRYTKRPEKKGLEGR